MNSKALITIGIFIGSTVGGYIPSLWGEGMFSPWSILTSGAGAITGLWAGFKLSNW